MKTPAIEQRLLQFFQESTSRPLLLRELLQQFPSSKKEIQVLKKTLQKLVQEGKLFHSRGNRYGLTRKKNLMNYPAASSGKSDPKKTLKGTLQGHRNGYGFVILEEEGLPDIFIPGRAMGGAMHGDKVAVQLERKNARGKSEGRISRILERAKTRMVGRFRRIKNMAQVIPFDRRISQTFYISEEHTHEAQEGDMVLMEISYLPDQKIHPRGKIQKILGRSNDPRIDTDIIIANNDLPLIFPAQALKEAEELPERVRDEAFIKRHDLRSLTTITIDGETARDFDDAVSAERLADGLIRLWVHIADVGHYAPWGGDLDQEAYLRGTSIYFPDRVLPMFPEKLSNHICSLVPHEDRLTLTCEMVFDSHGLRKSFSIYESGIQSDARMTYGEVKAILQNNPEQAVSRDKKILSLLSILEDLSIRLTKMRRERGCIDFDLPEAEIKIDPNGHISHILPSERNIAHRIIEECMLAANETVAQHLSALNIPAIYRVHEEPDPDKIIEFIELVQSFGLHLPASSKIKPKMLQGLLDQVHETDMESLINLVLLRSMKQARYSTEGTGHFGLAAQHYTHFTSPIRRYPDLIVHRLLKEVLPLGSLSPKRQKYFQAVLPEKAKHCSDRERVAMGSEREVVESKKVRFMADKLGEEFDGHITGIQGFGFFVELESIFVEGLVPITSLNDDYYIFMEKKHSLIGENQRRVFQIGNKLRVRVERVDLEQRKIEFGLVQAESTEEKQIKNRSSAHKKPRKKQKEKRDVRTRKKKLRSL